MEFETLVFVEFNCTSHGPYALPARLITDLPKVDGLVWVQYFVPETGPIYLDGNPFNGEQLKCLLLPICENVREEDLTRTLMTVSYTFFPLHGSDFLCVGLYCGDRRMLPLLYEAEQFKRLFQRREMMDVEIFYGEMDELEEWLDIKPSVARFLSSMLV